MCLSLMLSLGACGKKETEITELSFSSAIDLATIRSLNGKTVSVTGYMATLSPISGKFMYLMNMPYQSCPFCLPNTSQLNNTMAVYAPQGKTFEFTDQAIRVTGTMEVGSFKDEYSYEYNYRLVDATYEIISLSTVSEEYALWSSLAADGVVGDINAMFDYVFFLCAWPDYQGKDVSGNVFYFYVGDVDNCLNGTGMMDYSANAAQDYFDNLVARVRAVSSDQLNDIIEIIRSAQQVEKKARQALTDGAYTYDETEDKFTLVDGEQLIAEFYDSYYAFSDWLARWKL